MVQVSMKEIPISKFKATCLAVLEDVRRTRRPVRVTRFGKPVADVVPPKPELKNEPKKKSWMGYMEGTGEIVGDIVGPMGDAWGKRRLKMLDKLLK